MSELLQLIVTLLPQIANYSKLVPEAIEVVKALYEMVTKVITIAKGVPMDAEGAAALDALIEWQSQQPWGNIEYQDGPNPT